MYSMDLLVCLGLYVRVREEGERKGLCDVGERERERGGGREGEREGCGEVRGGGREGGIAVGTSRML